jgi:hypothetical protein
LKEEYEQKRHMHRSAVLLVRMEWKKLSEIEKEKASFAKSADAVRQMNDALKSILA